MLKEIKECRVCKNTNLSPVLSLGNQTLTGVFPKEKDEKVTAGPLTLVWCRQCGLLQLSVSYDLKEMYGDKIRITWKQEVNNLLIETVMQIGSISLCGRV